MCQVRTVSVLVLIFAITHTGYTLQCWKCYSDYDVTCRDHFNITRIQENRRHFDNFNYGNNRQIQPVRNDPHLEVCDDTLAGNYNQKSVCLKRVYKGNYGLPVVHRECRLVPRNLKEGSCPDDLAYDTSRTVTYCGTCEYDGCNAATSITLNNILFSLIPVGTLLMFRN
ncbi:uncharacterized protein [Leptinotarsa decemlineata]|uniref:uncharacterized protein n=1 Tax=Leptinotarsa decemlineata TaxID=7539 RepID=UPI003D305124